MNVTRERAARAIRPLWFVLVGLLAVGAAFAHAARHWLYVPLPNRAAATGLAKGTPTEGASPLATFALPGSERMRFSGRVVDRLETGSYIYLEIDRGDAGRAWVVTLRSSAVAIADAEDVSVVAVGYAPHFDSKRLRRSFDGLYFAVVKPS